jgi:MFS family permease
MVYTDTAATLLTIGLYLSGSMAALLVLLLIRSAILSLNVPAQQAYIKHVVTKEHLLKASSYTTIVAQMGKIIGPLLGALLLVFASARLCLALNAVSFAISALILLSLPKDEIEKTEQNKKEPWFKELSQGAQYICKVPLLRATMFIVFLWFFGNLVRQTQLVILLKELLPQQKNALGIFMGLDGLGVVMVSTLLSRKTNITHYGLYFFWGFLLLGLGILGVVFTETVGLPFYWLYISAIIIGLGTGIRLVNYGYIIKKESPK